jgi:4-hydroxy-tetrahydrodipicolinate synthase
MTKLTEAAAGVFVIAPTPFHDDGAIDMDSIDTMVEFYLGAGADGLTIMGMMGEAEKLAASEAEAVIARVMKAVAGRVPVVVGVSAPGFAAMQALARNAMDAGAAAVMVAPPSSLRLDARIRDYFLTAADILGPDTPFVLQDFPLATGVPIANEVILDVVAQAPTCVMLKHEDWPGLGKISALRKASDAGARRISILCGNGGMFLPEEIGRGADGAMTGFAFPEMMIGVCRHMAANDAERARDFFDAYLPLARYESQPGLGLAIRKYILAKRGIIGGAALRRPGARLSAADIGEIETLLARQDRRLATLI